MQELHRVLNMPQYGGICLNMFEFTIMDRVLNMYHTIHSGHSTI